MQKKTNKNGTVPREQRSARSGERTGLLLSYQETARVLGVTKTDVSNLVNEGTLRSVSVGDTQRIAAYSVIHILGYDPFGCSLAALPGSERYTRLTFEEYAVRQLNRGIGKAKSRSIENYRCGLRMTGSELGGLPMAEIEEADLRRAFRNLSGRYSKSSLHLAYQATRCLFRQAYDAGEIPKDPTHAWVMPKSTKPRSGETERVYSQERIEEILRTSKKYDQELYTMFAVLECTGMRPGELLALEWSAFNARAKTICVYQTVTREFGRIRTLDRAAASTGVLSAPKSEYSVRTLSLSDTAVDALCAWRRTSAAKKRATQGGFIFPGKHGGFRSLSGAEGRLQRYRAACGVDHVTFYKFRHTMCTRLVLAGQPLSVIQRIMGDNSTDVITRVYTHVDEDEALRAMRRYHEACRSAYPTYGIDGAEGASAAEQKTS